MTFEAEWVEGTLHDVGGPYITHTSTSALPNMRITNPNLLVYKRLQIMSCCCISIQSAYYCHFSFHFTSLHLFRPTHSFFLSGNQVNITIGTINGISVYWFSDSIAVIKKLMATDVALYVSSSIYTDSAYNVSFFKYPQMYRACEDLSK